MNKYGKVFVYPFNAGFNPILRYKDMFSSEINFIGLVSPSGWSLQGKDASFADKGSHIGISVTNNFDKMLNLCDSVWFIESDEFNDYEKIIYPNILKAINSKKRIIWSVNSSKKKENIKELCKKNKIEFFDFTNNSFSEYQDLNREIYNINVPIIAVAGLINNCGKFETQLALRKYITKMGYKVSQISSRNNCGIYDFHPFPGFMFDKSIDNDKKIIMYNRFLKQIETSENPDIIIIGIPGGVLPICDKDVDNFGVTAYLISQAVNVDITVFNTLYEINLNERYLRRYQDIFKYRFGYAIKCFNIYNKSVDWNSYVNGGTLSFHLVSQKLVEEFKKNNGYEDFKIYSSTDEFDKKEMSDYVIETLSNYAKKPQ